MYAEATKYLYSLMTRIGKIVRTQPLGENGEEVYSNDIALLALLVSMEESAEPVRLRMTDVSRALAISKPAATQMVNHLVKSGLVERTHSKSDRRVVYIQATPEGKRSFVHVMKSRMVYIERAVHRIGVERAALLGELLNEFVDALVTVTEEENASSATEEQSKC